MAATSPPEAAPRPSAEAILERERRFGPRAALAALGAAVLAVITGVAPQAIYSDSPHVYVIESLRDAAGEPIGRAGLRTAQVLFLDDKAVPLLLVALAQALMVVLIAVVLLYLLRGAQERGAAVPGITRLLVLFGAAGTAIGSVALQVAVMLRAHDFATSADHSTKAAHDVLRGGGVVAFSAVGTFGQLALAGGFVMVALAAMRAGLLTRFVGVLGAIVGVLLVLGPASGSNGWFVVQSFWLLLVGALLFGRWPSGVPPAWTSGEAVPWPSQQEIREQRDAARGRRPAPKRAAQEPAREPAGAVSPAASRKKKRKRRS